MKMFSSTLGPFNYLSMHFWLVLGNVCYAFSREDTKIDNVSIFVLLKFKNKEDRKINHFNMNSKYHGTFAWKFIQISAI